MKSCPSCQEKAPLLWTREGEFCRNCSRSEPLVPSSRQHSLLERGFLLSGVFQALLFPWATPALFLLSFLLALWQKIEGAWRMIPGGIAICALWIMLVPALIDNPSGQNGILVILFLLLAAALQLPGILLARRMIFRGRGLLAGNTLATISLPLLFALLLVLFALV